jgi:uncharacterized protein DUF998
MMARMVNRSGAAWLLAGGFIGPVLFVAVVLVAGWARPGYDPAGMYLSYLALGDGGWLLIATTVVSGLLIGAGAVGLRRVMRSGRGARLGPVLIGLVGLFVVVSGILVPDHARGYPPGTPLGPPADPSLVARLHDVAAGIAIVCLIEAMLVFAWRFSAEVGGARCAAYSRLTAIGATAFLLASFPQTDVLGALERTALVLAAGWLALVMWRFRREAAAPG